MRDHTKLRVFEMAEAEVVLVIDRSARKCKYPKTADSMPAAIPRTKQKIEKEGD